MTKSCCPNNFVMLCMWSWSRVSNFCVPPWPPTDDRTRPRMWSNRNLAALSSLCRCLCPRHIQAERVLQPPAVLSQDPARCILSMAWWHVSSRVPWTSLPNSSQKLSFVPCITLEALIYHLYITAEFLSGGLHWPAASFFIFSMGGTLLPTLIRL
jgi:hypothetical protein